MLLAKMYLRVIIVIQQCNLSANDKIASKQVGSSLIHNRSTDPVNYYGNNKVIIHQQ